MLVRWLMVFHTVHGLSTIPELADVFFNPATKKLRIRGEKTVEQLSKDVARCSLQLHLKGSPYGFDPSAPRGSAGAQDAAQMDASEREGRDGF